MNGISINDIEINNGFWKYRQELNRSTTVFAVYKRFKESGRFDAFKCKWKEGEPNKPHIFWDSDVAKWIEGASYIMKKEKNAGLEQIIDEVVDDIDKNMDTDGYFNSYYLTMKNEKRWSVRANHELYCAGHLIEAAVAYYEATGKDKFLKLMCKYADCIYRVFVEEKSAAFSTPGHEEIELALFRLYNCTNCKKYFELAKFFINERGKEIKRNDNEYRVSMSIQSHIPVREQKTAEGHCVRALYLYSAMADMALMCGDAELQDSCEKIFDDIISHKMYITGGLGSTRIYEGFTLNYDLPSAGAYAESCAAIAMCMFAKRMLKIEANSKYADICELEFYNGFLSSTSLDGKAFFYENPLELQPKLRRRNVAAAVETEVKSAITERVEIFDCSCCLPNIVRFIPCFGEYMYNYDEKNVYVHHYASSIANVGGAQIEQITDYPNSGKIIIKAKNVNTIAVRIPSWSKNYTVQKDGQVINPNVSKGYAYIEVNGNAKIELNLELKVQTIEANPNVTACAGKMAVKRGVFVYCMESVDNGKNLNCLRMNPNAEFKSEYSELFKTDILTTVAYKTAYNSDELYMPSCGEEETEVKLIPYYAFANRGESEMIVWINRK